MTKRKAERPQYMSYPKEVAGRCGIKVSWNYYKTKEEADECAKAARHNARIQESLGYDFGYCCPGSVTLIKEGEHAGLYEVCLP